MPKAEKYFLIRYTVTGTGKFPLDMLRYDRSTFYSEEDANAAEYTNHGRTLKLLRFSRAGKSDPCVARWKSFGWEVRDIVYGDEP